MCISMFWLFLFQSDPIRPLDAHLMTNAATTRALQEHQRRAGEEERREFEQRFNKFIDTLQGFSNAYKQSQGQVWPRKEAEAIRKAYRDLERHMPLNGREDAPGTRALGGVCHPARAGT